MAKIRRSIAEHRRRLLAPPYQGEPSREERCSVAEYPSSGPEASCRFCRARLLVRRGQLGGALFVGPFCTRLSEVICPRRAVVSVCHPEAD